MSVRRLGGRARETIPFGAQVLCRNGEVGLACPDIANAVARHRPTFGGPHEYWEGDYLMCDPIDGLGSRDLHAIANGPIMDPLRLYLPAGKVSEAEYQARLADDFGRAGITR